MEQKFVCDDILTFNCQVDGVEVSIGEETEPVLLNIAPPQGDSFIRGFSRSLLLDEVVRLACDEFQLDEARVAVQRPVGKGTDYRHTKHRACFLIVRSKGQ